MMAFIKSKIQQANLISYMTHNVCPIVLIWYLSLVSRVFATSRPGKYSHTQGSYFMRFKDRNVTYHSLVGMDTTPDQLEEMLRLRIFLVSKHEDHDMNSPIIVRGSIMRESLDFQPEWDVECNPRHYCVCLDYQWKIRFYIRSRKDGTQFPMAFMDEIPGVPYYFERCPRAQGGHDPHANISPFFMQGVVPSNRSGEDFELGVVGWSTSSRFILRPQLPMARIGGPEIWHMLQLQGQKNDESMQPLWASTIAMHVQYHRQIGFAGTIMVVDHDAMQLLSADPKASKLIEDGSLVLILLEAAKDCVMTPLCFGDEVPVQGGNDFTYRWQPFVATAVGFFMWSTHSYIGFVDPDEYLIISRTNTSVQDLLIDPSCWANAKFIALERYTLALNVRTGGIPHAKYWALQPSTTWRDVMGQYELTNTHAFLEKTYAAVDNIVAARVHSLEEVNGTRLWIARQQECGFLGHLHSWFVNREEELAMPTTQTWGTYELHRSWMWPLLRGNPAPSTNSLSRSPK